MTRELIRVGIIGSGASGLAQLKQLLDAFARPEVKRRADLEVVCFEKQEEVGGVWFANEDAEKRYRTASTDASSSLPAGEQAEQVYVYPPAGEDPSPMYEGLRTNLPHDLMAFRSLPMPPSLPLFPTRAQIQAYLVSYATIFDLYPYIRFRTTVRRLYQPSDPSAAGGRRWMIEYAGADGDVTEMGLDFVCCANGHYADGWIAPVPGLSSFKGKVVHSRYFRSAEDYTGQKVLVVGSFASGGDISRLLAAYNLGMYTKTDNSANNGGTASHNGRSIIAPERQIDVHVSCSARSAFSVDTDDPDTPWGKYVTYHPLIDHISSSGEDSIIHFEDETALEGVDTIIFATGYNFALPFAKGEDRPWCDSPLFDKRIEEGERELGHAWEKGGLKGLGVKGLDGLMLFMENDRSICFPVMQYQVVPFPLAESQTRLSALLWAGLLPSFPDNPQPPRNASNPYSSSPPSTSTAKSSGAFSASDPQPPPEPSATAVKPPRKVMQTRQKLVFGAPYEWEYQEYLMELMVEADKDGVGVEECWKGIEGFRREKRADTGLRKRTLGY